MVFYDLIPTAATPMSEYTRMTFFYVVAIGTISFGAIIWWTKREVKRMDKRIDAAVKTTDAMETTMNKVETNIAVILQKIDAIEKGTTKTEESIGKINDVLLSWKT